MLKLDKHTVCKVLIGVFLVLSLIACGAGSALRDVASILDEAIDKLETQSISWQNVLEDTHKELVNAGQTTIANEVSNILTEAISDIGVEARCYTDFMRDRVKEDLIRIRARYTGEKLSLNPVFCSPNPKSIDFEHVESGRQKTIDIVGYNLDSTSIKVLLLDSQGQQTDVSDALANPTRYLITLNLGSNGVPLSSKSNKIIFSLSNNEKRTVNVIQSIIPIKEQFQPEPVRDLCPRHIGGDRDFGDNGPDVFASAQLQTRNNNTEIWIRLFLNVIETKSDWTEAEKSWDVPIWNAPSGYRIIEIAPDSKSTASYRDVNHQIDRPSIRGGPLVKRFEIIGDTKGDDVGNCTKDDVYMDVHFNEIEIIYEKY